MCSFLAQSNKRKTKEQIAGSYLASAPFAIFNIDQQSMTTAIFVLVVRRGVTEM